MSSSAVELNVGGQTYRVVASAEEAELRRLAQLVDERLRELSPPGRQIPQQAVVLAAISLAHDLEEERARRKQVEQQSREMLSNVLRRIDAALEGTEDAGPGEAVRNSPESNKPAPPGL